MVSVLLLGVLLEIMVLLVVILLECFLGWIVGVNEMIFFSLLGSMCIIFEFNFDCDINGVVCDV